MPMRANDAARDSTIRHVFTFFTSHKPTQSKKLFRLGLRKMTEIVIRLKYLGNPSDSGPETNWTEFNTQKYSNDMYIS